MYRLSRLLFGSTLFQMIKNLETVNCLLPLFWVSLVLKDLKLSVVKIIMFFFYFFIFKFLLILVITIM